MRRPRMLSRLSVFGLVCLFLGQAVGGLTADVEAAANLDAAREPGAFPGDSAPVATSLQKVAPTLTSPSGAYRWLDAADQLYAQSYQDTYDYAQASVQVNYENSAMSLEGSLATGNLKPNFAYQAKLLGTPGTASNERIGLAGRWWEETWDGSEWTNGHNLNNKGDGTSPNPNDETYYARRDIVDPTSPTGKKYRYTGYMVFDYFVTDENGGASLSFEVDSSYHVLWKTSQRSRGSSDGPLKTHTFDPNSSSPAYEVDYGQSTVGVFGEWERLPVGGVYLQPGDYTCQILLTEESFHGSCELGSCELAGNWAAAMGGAMSFQITAPYTLTMAVSPTSGGTTSPAPGSHFYYEGGESVTVRAIPGSGYRFVSWVGDVADPEAQTTSVLMDGDRAATAHFEYTGAEEPPDGEGDCFIVTAACDPDDSNVDALRAFRDSYLTTDPLGSGFVSAYYRLSPPVAEFIDEHPLLKPAVRTLLLPALAVGAATINVPVLWKIVLMFLILCVSGVLLVKLCRRGVVGRT